jgi:hypothetical protein
MSDATPSSPLEKLHDVIVVEQVSAWPPAPIWYMVLIIALGLLTALFIYLKKQRHYKQAKKEAIHLANSLMSYKDNLDITHLNELQHILKRLAKHYYGARTAALSGKQWAQFVNSSCKTQCDNSAFNLLYQAKLSDEQVSNLKSLLISAIKKMNISKSHINLTKGSL